MELDLVLQGGLVYDGSGSPPIETDVGVAGDRIVEMGRDLRGKDALDCRGLAVAPGFIDTHSHSDLRVLIEPGLQMKVRQGVAVEVFGQDGMSVAPVRPENRHAWRERLAGLLGDPGLPWDWTSAADYLRTLDVRPAAVDRCYLVPHGALRLWVLGNEDRPATAPERQRMRARLMAELDAGALGMSTGLVYPPCCYADTEELCDLAEVLARRNKVLAVHLRSESDRVLEAVDEMIAVADRSGVHVHISHLKIAGRANWPKADGLLHRLREARARRLRFTADQYPYVAGATVLSAILPPWAQQGGVAGAVARLADPVERAKIRQAILDPAASDWDNFYKAAGPEGIVISEVASGRRPGLVSKNLLTCAQEAGRAAARVPAAASAGAPGVPGASAAADPLEFALDLLRDERLAVGMIVFSQSEDVIAKLWAEPYVNGATDALLVGRSHPRVYGSFPRMLRWLVREVGATTLEEAVRKLTRQAAENMHLPASFGRIAAGAVAHLVAFDPDKVTDLATFDEPTLYPAGMPHVVVRGRAVVRGGEPTGELPGRVVRG